MPLTSSLLITSLTLVASWTHAASVPPYTDSVPSDFPLLESETLEALMRHPYTDDVMDMFFTRSICRTDDSVEAKCYEELEDVYDHSLAVLRISKNGRAHCTGWLVGDEGHVITNNHCVASQDDTDILSFEAMAEGDECTTKCNQALGCPGVIVHQAPLTFVATGGNLQEDWTLLQLPESDREFAVQNFGFLQLRASGPVNGESIYIPQHPRGYGKKIAMKDGMAPATIIDTDYNGGCGSHEVAYKADTEGGSSGSPVLGLEDHAVIALHHCGGCSYYGNTAVHMDSLVKGMKDLLPASAFTTLN